MLSTSMSEKQIDQHEIDTCHAIPAKPAQYFLDFLSHQINEVTLVDTDSPPDIRYVVTKRQRPAIDTIGYTRLTQMRHSEQIQLFRYPATIEFTIDKIPILYGKFTIYIWG